GRGAHVPAVLAADRVDRGQAPRQRASRQAVLPARAFRQVRAHQGKAGAQASCRRIRRRPDGKKAPCGVPFLLAVQRRGANSAMICVWNVLLDPRGVAPGTRPQRHMNPPSATRARRAPVRPQFDAAAQPWTPADDGLAALSAERLTPDALRNVLGAPPDWQPEPTDEARMRYPGREGPPVEAAVLIPLVMHEDGVRVMLTRRTAHLHDHAGQISFPGGRI